MIAKFRVEFLVDAAEFIDKLDKKTRNKVIYNIQKARVSNDKELFSKLKVKFGSLALYITKPITGFLPFGT
jgi:hypothetical protein